MQSVKATSSEPLASQTQPLTQARTLALSLLLILLPFSIAIALRPGFVAMVFVAALLVAYKTHCLKALLMVLGVSFALLFFFPTPAAIYCDADHFHLPAIRIIAGLGDVNPMGEGGIWWTHFKANLPDGFHRYGAALYRLTGWTDTANSLLFILFVPAWLMWREHLGPWARTLLLLGPLVFASCFNPLPDGATYLLLVTALGALKGKHHSVVLAAILLATTLKVTAWVPACFIAGVLLYQAPSLWRRILLVGLIAIAYNLGFFIHHFLGTPLPTGDFAAMEGSARTLGWFARFAYAYLGHWLLPGDYTFNVPVGGFDGGGIDGLGPVFRALTWLSLALLIAFYKRLKPWRPILFICWGSSLCVSTLYMGYARYVPLIYLAVMLPLICLAPRLATIPALLVCLMPMAWIGWRLVLITERLTVFDPTHTASLSSETYNIRCHAREMGIPLAPNDLRTQGAFIPSGSLMYAYAPNEAITPFPAIPRTYDRDQRLLPVTQKIDSVAAYLLTDWLPWSLCNLHRLGVASLRYRVRAALTFPRGSYDTPTVNHR